MGPRREAGMARHFGIRIVAADKDKVVGDTLLHRLPDPDPQLVPVRDDHPRSCQGEGRGHTLSVRHHSNRLCQRPSGVPGRTS